MSALAFDFSFDEAPADHRLTAPGEAAHVPAHASGSPGTVGRPQPTAGGAPGAWEDGVAAAPAPRRRLYAVRGTVGEPVAVPFAPVPGPPAAPALRIVPTPTLDAILGQAWSALGTGFTACPVCQEETMTARWSAGHHLAGGRCASCGSTLE